MIHDVMTATCLRVCAATVIPGLETLFIVPTDCFFCGQPTAGVLHLSYKWQVAKGTVYTTVTQVFRLWDRVCKLTEILDRPSGTWVSFIVAGWLGWPERDGVGNK